MAALTLTNIQRKRIKGVCCSWYKLLAAKHGKFYLFTFLLSARACHSVSHTSKGKGQLLWHGWSCWRFTRTGVESKTPVSISLLMMLFFLFRRKSSSVNACSLLVIATRVVTFTVTCCFRQRAWHPVVASDYCHRDLLRLPTARTDGDVMLT